MNIYYFTPYSLSGDLAQEINKYVKLVPNDNDWIVIMDGDIIFTNADWGNRFAQMIEANPKYDMLTIPATRIGVKEQKLNGIISPERDLVNLHEMCERQFRKIKSYAAVPATAPLGGYFLCFRKKLGMAYPFITSKQGILGVDGTWTKLLLDKGKKVGICNKLPVIHFYRANKNCRDTRHLFGEQKTYLTSKVDITLTIPRHFKGMPNDKELKYELKKDVPREVPEYVARFYITGLRKHLFTLTRGIPGNKKDDNLKILVATNHLKNIGGSETFTYTLAKELKRQGHQVEVFTFHEGLVSKKIKEEGIPVITDILFPVNSNYDLILANHNTTVEYLRGKFPQTKIIQTCHGTGNKFEQPNKKADKFVAISKEIQNYLQEKYSIQSEIILNGVDCERFSLVKPLNEKIQTVLSMTHSNSLNIRLREILKKKGIKLITMNKYKNPKWNIEDFINMADMVIAIGRGVYESMACGRPVLVLDERKYQGLLGDGFLTQYNIHDSILFNCSGRWQKRTDIENMIEEAIEQYDYKTEFYEDYAREHLNIQKQVEKYLALVHVK